MPSVKSLASDFDIILMTYKRFTAENNHSLSLGEKSTKNAGSQDDETSDIEFSDSGADTLPQSQNLSVASSRNGSPIPSKINASPRIWTKYDREDLSKLGKMISHFIAVPQFTANPKLISTHIVEPLLDPGGPRPGAVQVLNQVMEMTMIRHRIEDVEEDVVLPPFTHESILLDLDTYAVKSYNAMQAAIAINAVDSQRTDQDYMFHPRNADALQTTVKNMSQSLAIEDRLWRAIQAHEDVPYRVRGLNRRIFEAWTRTPYVEPSHIPSLTGFIHVDRLLKMQDLVVQRPLIPEDTFIECGGRVKAEDILLRNLYIESQKGKNRNLRRKVKPHQDDINAGLKAEDAAKKARDPAILKEMTDELDNTLTQLDGFEEEAGTLRSEPSAATSNAFEFHGGGILSKSLLGSVRLGSTTSSKLNYIINEILQYAKDEKFLIFSDSELSLAHVAEALELMHVKFLRFTTQIEARRREQMVLTFETSEKYRVFLMELKHGARGLNLISASRVIFCEPVWQADVESQAIKRAHRIGQTRPITVKTLAIRGTAEENMVARRNILRDSNEKVPKLTEEAGMRHFIANPKFINYTPERYSTVDMPLLTVRPSDIGSETSLSPTLKPPSLKRIWASGPIGRTLEETGVEFSKKKRVVHFG
ncbi:hypothetical protein H0H81_002536 [Sphagnurus paluster]|uniref:Helicase C-terminal domain-containing protein n=1 Tax=Sphagnurus paluster TaxID=117069 RepID=A0A9P7FZF7_9AGAR|nr:hypothetical protein H0H81_002536 [Sphagnurus paluster]